MKMEKGSFSEYLLKAFIIGITFILIFNLHAKAEINDHLCAQNQEKSPEKILKEIYNEVIELKSYEGEEFLRREFFMNLDEEERGKREHVVVLIHKEGKKEKMMLQVTYLESRMESSIIKHARATKKISSLIKGNRLEIEESSYEKEEIKSLLPKILKNICLKKEYLKLLKKKKGRFYN